MVFSEALFLFLFLPLVLGIYAVTPQRLRNITLLSASLVFYAIGEGKYLSVMLASIALNYFMGLWIAQRSQRAPLSSTPVITAVVLNLGLLIAYKYTGFLCENLNGALSLFGSKGFEVPQIHLPIGISFFTFQAMSYAIDVHRKETEVQRNPLDLALYIALFPQLIAGPIVRYTTVAAEIKSRIVGVEGFASGVQRFIIGLSKKMLLSNPTGRTADLIFALPSTELSAPIAWLGIACYTLQIYFDFSGYSDMAIGLGKMFGFNFEENFDYPYISKSVTEFWRRWHISLSTWFRDYLYIPLGGNRTSPARTYVNLLIVFILCGFWHGASWNFLIWGLIHGTCLVLERSAFRHRLARLGPLVQHLYVLLLVMIGWVFFRAETLGESMNYLGSLLGQQEVSHRAQGLAFFLNTELILVIALACIGATRIPLQVASVIDAKISPLLRVPTLAILLFVCASHVAAGSYNPFIYFRF